MLGKKNNIVVGLTTFNTDMLMISVTGLARIKARFTLIIHNDNPDVKLTRRMVRKYGYRGDLYIINSDETIGLRAARVRLMDAARTYVRGAQWIIFADDDDVLLNIDIPDVASNVFAVLQNSLVINTNISDLIGAATHPTTITPDGKNIVLQRPHLGMRGTALHIDPITTMAMSVIDKHEENLRKIDNSMGHVISTDQTMWSALNAIIRYTTPEYAPIFMDSVNYIQNNIDKNAAAYVNSSPTTKQKAAQKARIQAIYDNVIQEIIANCQPS